MKQISRIVIVFVALVLLVPRMSHAQANAVLENPAPGQIVSGIRPITGWAFAVLAGLSVPITVHLFVDGRAVGTVPCCVPRGDVAAAFGPQVLNSGFGQNVNFNLLPDGPHTITIEVRDILGTPLLRRESAITVVRPGGFEFIDQLLIGGRAQIVGQVVVLENVQIRETGTSEAQRVTLGLTWLPNAQALGIVSAVSASSAASAQSTAQAAADSRVTVQAAVNSPNITAELENPPLTQGVTVSGIGVVSGWAFSTVGGAINALLLRVDGTPFTNILCCTPRADVARMFGPAALNSGFGALTNFNLLPSGAHVIGAEIRDSVGNVEVIERPVTAVKLANSEFLDQFLFTANTRALTTSPNLLILDRVQVRDKATQVVQEIAAAFTWEKSCQCFVARPLCGNGGVEGMEECDGAALNGATCGALGFGGGNLGCRVSCEFETNQCTGGPSLFVTNSMDDTVSVINPATNTVTNTLRVGNEPRGVAVTPNKAAAYVTNFRSDSVSVLSTTPPTVVGTIRVGNGPQGVAFSPNGTQAYVVNGLANTVSVINVATNTVTATVPVGQEPQEIAVTPDGALGYVTNFAADSVSVINLATNVVGAAVGVGEGPSGIAATPDGTKILVTNFDDASLSVIDRATNTVTRTIPMGLQPARIAFSPDGTRAFITNFLEGAIAVVDLTTLGVVNNIVVDDHVLGIALAAGGRRIYVTLFGSGGFGRFVEVVNTLTGQVTNGIRVGDGPLAIAGTP